MSKDDSGPAFPTIEEQYSGMDQRWATVAVPGMTKRDYFAGQALQGMLARNVNRTNYDDVAYDSYAYADAMIKQRSDR